MGLGSGVEIGEDETVGDRGGSWEIASRWRTCHSSAVEIGTWLGLGVGLGVGEGRVRVGLGLG